MDVGRLGQMCEGGESINSCQRDRCGQFTTREEEEREEEEEE